MSSGRDGQLDPAINDQVEELFLGSDFGDEDLQAAMRQELTERLAMGRPLSVYAGYDPTKPDLHIGHAITLRKLRRFQQYGHRVTVIVGTFTAVIGDTSDKKDQRAAVARETVHAAGKTYAEQVARILDPELTSIQFNHTWLDKLGAADIVELASQFTVQQFQIRANYRERLATGKPVGLHEFLYALFQGYDAVHLHTDVQIGATEQLFNIMAGRRLQRFFGQQPCIAITFPVLVGTDGVERMSKSKGNYIGIAEEPAEQYGKVMSVSDETMMKWIPLVADWDREEVLAVVGAVSSGSLHAMDLKKRLARRVVELYHGPEAADAAADDFERIHQRRQVPAEMPTVELLPSASVIDALLRSGAASSRSAARRLVEGRGVTLDERVVSDGEETIVDDSVLRVGKRRFYRLSTRDD